MSVILNVILFLLKFIAGKISGSVSITADAFNNLTDAGTVLLTSFGVRISSLGPGKKHPDGHGKFEWVFALITSFSVLLVGWELFQESIHSIHNPADTIFSWVTLIILVLSIGVKIFLYFFNMNKSKKKNILSLKAVAIDSLSDAFATIAVLISLLLNTFFGWHVDGFCGLIVSVLIMYNALKSASESISRIVGTAASDDEIEELRNYVKSFFQCDIPVIGLQILDNGYDRHKVSFHMVSNDQISADELLTTVPLIQKQIKIKYGFDSIIQVEKAAEHMVSDRIIEKAEEHLKNAGYSYELSDARVLLCQDHTYQLVAYIQVPWFDSKKIDEIKKYISSPGAFGLEANDSAFVKIMFKRTTDRRSFKKKTMYMLS